MKKIFSLLLFTLLTVVVFAQDIAAEIPAVIEDCATCIPALLERNWPTLISCVVTAIAAGVVRYFEKKKMKRNK